MVDDQLPIDDSTPGDGQLALPASGSETPLVGIIIFIPEGEDLLDHMLQCPTCIALITMLGGDSV
jgi:hypothetical protein